MIFGREAERSALAAFADDLTRGRAAVLLEGEPGIGKSALWNEGVEFARRRGHAVLSCRPTPSDAGLSFVGLGDLFRGIPDAAIEDLPGPQREALEVALLRRPRGQRRPEPRAVAVAALGVVHTLARDAPVVVAVDDVYWLDAATARVLSFVVRRLSNVPAGFLLARSNVEAPPPLGIDDALSPERIRRITVGPLGAETLVALVREGLGSAISLPDARHLAEVSGGNPFFALEIARAAARGDTGVTGQALPIPKTLRDDVVSEHLGRLPRATQDLLLVAASVSRPTMELLRAASDGSRTASSIQLAVDAGIVTVTGSDVRFVHPIYRSAIYAQASRTRRHSVHRRLAELTPNPEERARHLALSADGADETIAAILDDAAASARDRGAPDTAAELLEHGIRLTPPGSLALSRRHLEAADHRLLAGDPEGALTHAREALRLSDPGVGRARALRFMAAIDLERGRIADARRALEDATAEAHDDSRAAAEVERDLARLELASGNLTLANRHARSALEQAERAGDTSLLPSVRTTLARVALLLGDAENAFTGEAEPLGTETPILAIELVTAEAEIIAAEHGRARERLEAVRAAAAEHGDEPGRRAALVRLAEVEVRDGSWERAESLADEARTLSRQLGIGDALELGLLAYVAAARGKDEDARVDADLGLRAAGDDRMALLWNLGALGLLELSLGRPEQALRHSGRVGGIATEMGLGEPAALPFLPDEAEALVGVGELDAAERRIAWLEERGAALARGSALAAAARCRGQLLAEAGELAGALTSLERSIELYEPLPLPFDRARAFLALGSTRRRDRQKRPARDALGAALEAFEALGAATWAVRARDELSRVSGRRASITELTEAEARVVRLAASGLTNREIARSLFMSVRTVEGHLSHAYAKLGVRSRTELAVFLQGSD